MTDMTGKYFFRDFLILKEQLIQYFKPKSVIRPQYV